MKTYFLHTLAVAVSAFFIYSIPSHACTDFRLKAKDGTVLITRSMEFGEELQSNLRSSFRGRVFTTTTANKKPGLTWKAKYGYLYLDGFNIDASFDGMNETGLTFEYLYLPGETHYQSVPAGKESHAVPYVFFGDWVLGNFKTTAEVKQALKSIYVTTQIIPQIGNAELPAHAAIYDPSGNGIIVEFYDNKINVFDSVGVMTNSPKYEWQVTNLRNFLNLSPNNPDTIHQGRMAYTATGQGSGAVGLPGDASPPSRFVKTAFMAQNVFAAENASGLINLAEHIINNVDLPAGYVRSINNNKTTTDTTQWVVFKDMTHKILYFRTYNDMTLRSISLEKIDFTEYSARLKMPLIKDPIIKDLTDYFINMGKSAVS